MTSGEGATSCVLALMNLSKAWLPASDPSSGSPCWAACCCSCCVCGAGGTGMPCPGCGTVMVPAGLQMRSLQVEMPTPRSCSRVNCLAAGSEDLDVRQAAGEAARMRMHGTKGTSAPGRIGGRHGPAEQQLAVACSGDTLSSCQGIPCTAELRAASRHTVQLPVNGMHYNIVGSQSPHCPAAKGLQALQS